MRFPLPGEEFEGKYLIESVLGSGGFACVYKAWEYGLERHVALKVLRPPTLERQSTSEQDRHLSSVIARFEREGHLLSRLKSPYTVTLYGFGETPEGLLYMALEFIDGQSLAQLREDGCSLEPERVVKIMRQVLLSLKEAHALGMLHRDLKPANIMVYEYLGESDLVKLVDFGIAKTFGETKGRDLTSDGTLIGTPRYMAPEQIKGVGVSPSSDIYSLGLVAFELLTGERAITSDNSFQIIGEQMGPVSFTVPTDLALSLGLRGVVNQMLDKNQSRRYQSVVEVLEDLDKPGVLLNAEPATVKMAAILPFPEAKAPDESIEGDLFDETLTSPEFVWPRETPKEREKETKKGLNRTLLGVALVLSLLLIGLGTLTWVRQKNRVLSEIPVPSETKAELESATVTTQEFLEKAEEAPPEEPVKASAQESQLDSPKVDESLELIPIQEPMPIQTAKKITRKKTEKSTKREWEKEKSNEPQPKKLEPPVQIAPAVEQDQFPMIE